MTEGRIEVTARGIIIESGKLLVFKLHPESDVWSLPGGRIEFGETIEEAVKRELIEETGIKPTVGKLIAINQMLIPGRHRIEFFYHILNSHDYLNIDLSKASHGHEVSAWQFADPQDEAVDIRPKFLREFVAKFDPSKFTELRVFVSR